MRTDLLGRKDEILKMISEKWTIQRMSFFFNCKAETLKRYFRRLGIEYNGAPVDLSKNGGMNYIPAIKYLQNAKICDGNILKKKLIREGIKEEKCEQCFNTEWLGQKLPVHLHHIDGDRSNNSLSNLQILCMNCHGLTENFGAKNSKAYKRSYLERIARAKCKAEQKLSKKERIKWVDEVARRGEEAKKRNSMLVELVRASGIDFHKFGWVNKVASLTGKKPQKINAWMQRYVPELYQIAFKRSRAEIGKAGHT